MNDLNHEGQDSQQQDHNRTDAELNAALIAGVPHAVPPTAVALFIRWWQLENWLRELTHLELRALNGAWWEEDAKVAVRRQSQDAAFTHMTGADNKNILAYLDFSQLVAVMDTRWDQVGYALPEHEAWSGRQAELIRIRNRLGHMRRPHNDDKARLKQTLRDLDRGAFIAFASYNRRRSPDRKIHKDPVTNGWIGGRHRDARRLVDHADRQYDTTVLVTASIRPWAEWPADLTRGQGLLWHCRFNLRGRLVDARKLWNSDLLAPIKPLVVHMLANAPWEVEFAFAAVDDADQIADAIGTVFDAVLTESRQCSELDDRDYEQWKARTQALDYRVMSRTGWNGIEETTLPVTIFGAGGNVEVAPSW